MKPTLEDFNAYILAMSKHDWYYDYSDDGNVWRRSEAQHQAIRGQAKNHPIYQKAYNIFVGFLNRGSLPSAEALATRDRLLNELRAELLLLP